MLCLYQVIILYYIMLYYNYISYYISKLLFMLCFRNQIVCEMYEDCLRKVLLLVIVELKGIYMHKLHVYQVYKLIFFSTF